MRCTGPGRCRGTIAIDRSDMVVLNITGAVIFYRSMIEYKVGIE